MMISSNPTDEKFLAKYEFHTKENVDPLEISEQTEI